MPNFAIITCGTPRQNSQRVLRGGSWINNARNLRSANRNRNSPDNRNHNYGLRLAGALSNYCYQKARIIAGGSINQWCFLFAECFNQYQQQNQDPRHVSRRIFKQSAKHLLSGRLYSYLGCSYASN